MPGKGIKKSGNLFSKLRRNPGRRGGIAELLPPHINLAIVHNSARLVWSYSFPTLPSTKLGSVPGLRYDSTIASTSLVPVWLRRAVSHVRVSFFACTKFSSVKNSRLLRWVQVALPSESETVTTKPTEPLAEKQPVKSQKKTASAKTNKGKKCFSSFYECQIFWVISTWNKRARPTNQAGLFLSTGKASSESKPKAQKPPGNTVVDVTRLDMRVGQIVKVDIHHDADTLYVEQVHVGEEANRTVVTSARHQIPIEQVRPCYIGLISMRSATWGCQRKHGGNVLPREWKRFLFERNDEACLCDAEMYGKVVSVFPSKKLLHWSNACFVAR